MKKESNKRASTQIANMVEVAWKVAASNIGENEKSKKQKAEKVSKFVGLCSKYDQRGNLLLLIRKAGQTACPRY